MTRLQWPLNRSLPWDFPFNTENTDLAYYVSLRLHVGINISITVVLFSYIV